MRKQYLKILGLSEDATDAEIKKAYRKKAFLYHPDLNDSPDAKEQFVRIDKAYQFLMNEDAEPELIYTPAKDDDDRIKNSARYRQMAKEFKKKQAEQYRQDIIRRMKIFRGNLLFDVGLSIFSLLIFTYGLLVIIDQTLSTNQDTFQVYGHGQDADGYYFIILNESGNLTVSASWEVTARIDAYGRPNSIVDIDLTPIFKLPKRIQFVNGWEIQDKKVPFNVLYNWGFPILMLLPVFWLFYRKPAFPMIVLGNCLLFVYPIIIGVHLYLMFADRTRIILQML